MSLTLPSSAGNQVPSAGPMRRTRHPRRSGTTSQDEQDRQDDGGPILCILLILSNTATCGPLARGSADPPPLVRHQPRGSALRVPCPPLRVICSALRIPSSAFGEFVFPDPHHPPARRPQGAVHPPVPRPVPLQLPTPPRRAVRRPSRVPRTPVPETTVHEHGHLELGKDEVRTNTHSLSAPGSGLR